MKRVIWYIDVGNLPKAKAEQYVKEISEKYLVDKQKNEQFWFLPVRDQPTRVEILE